MYLMGDMLNLFLLTFMFTYLMYSIQGGIMNSLGKVVRLNYVLVTVILYVIFASLIAIFIYKYIPIVTRQIINIIDQISEFDFTTLAANEDIKKYLIPLYEQVDIKGVTKNGVGYIIGLATNIGKWSVNIFIALILSMFFMLEKHKIKEFMAGFKNSRIGESYKYLQYFGNNFLNSFGKVMQAQILIALTNSMLSVVGLGILGFKQLLGLGVMIFFFSLVPVAGTIASLVPLSIIAFNLGGIVKIIYVLLMIAALHALESYVLNPKLMASKTELPVFVIFLLLIISEHLMGVWGLLLGIPLFMFILDLLNINIAKK
jgi:predicted PurR-regulated permease PerM